MNKNLEELYANLKRDPYNYLRYTDRYLAQEKLKIERSDKTVKIFMWIAVACVAMATLAALYFKYQH